jgi:vesicle coat complex subunit
MTLKEKYLELAFAKITSEELRDDCVIIAEDFAIGFLDWIVSEETKTLIDDLVIVGEVDENTTSKQLLEIYKKEKGL